MLVPLREWRAVEAGIFLLSTLAAVLGRIVECMLPTRTDFSGSRLVLLPVHTVGARTRRLVRYDRANRGFLVREAARSTIPATRASSRSRYLV